MLFIISLIILFILDAALKSTITDIEAKYQKFWEDKFKF